MPLQSMPSSSLQRLQTSSVGQRNSRRVLFGALLGGVLLVTIAAVCVVAAVITTGPSSDQKLSPVPDQGEMRPRQVFRGRRLKRHTRQSPSVPTRAIPTRATPTSAPINPQQSQDGSCISTANSSNIPAAHIKARGVRRGKWIESTSDTGSVVPGYQQRWQCNDVYTLRRVKEQAFVDGGVWFNQTDKSIYVPKCGYYLIYSQVLFVLDQSPSAGITVFHNLKIRHNCTWESDSGPIQLQAKASIGPFGPDNTIGGLATTFTSDVVHMCAGGNVWIEIPDGGNGVPCCPRGEESATFLGLVLIADTPCSSWPPEITMTNNF